MTAKRKAKAKLKKVIKGEVKKDQVQADADAKIIEELRTELELKSASVVRPPNNNPYLLAVVFMIMVAIVAVVLIITFRPDIDFLVVVASVTGIVMPTTISLLAFMKSQETHLSVNSRLDAFIANAEEAARARGVDEGRIKANQRTDQLATK